MIDRSRNVVLGREREGCNSKKIRNNKCTVYSIVPSISHLVQRFDVDE